MDHGEGFMPFFICLYNVEVLERSCTCVYEHAQTFGESTEPPACISESDKAHLGLLMIKGVGYTAMSHQAL